MKTETWIGIAIMVILFVAFVWDNRATIFYGKEVEMHPEQNTIPDFTLTCEPPRSRPLHEYSALNLNSIILVKLTDLGYKHLVSLHNANLNVIPEVMVRDPDYYRQRADDNGYTQFLLWEFIKKFGDVTGIACLDYYDTNIRIMNNDLTPVVP